MVQHNCWNEIHSGHLEKNILIHLNHDDYINLGRAEIAFYCTLVELLGTCAPSEEAVKLGKPSAVKARSILRSLVSIEDLKGVLAVRFCVCSSEIDMPPGLLPDHKMCIMFFLVRVYNIPDQSTLFELLESAFLPDIRYAILLDTADKGDRDFALALNRYICNSVMPLLTQNSNYFNNLEKYTRIVDMTLQFTYRFSRCKALTKNQRNSSMEFLVVLTSHLNPSFMNKLFGPMIEDISSLTESVIVTLKILSKWYERLRQYYGSNLASKKEQLITIMLFQVIFDTLSGRSYNPELFSRALPCMTAIACSLPPDCTLAINDSNNIIDKEDYFKDLYRIAKPVLTPLSDDISKIVSTLSNLIHENWIHKMIEEGWKHGDYNRKNKIHPNIKLYSSLSKFEREYQESIVVDALQAITANGYSLDRVDGGIARIPLHVSENLLKDNDNNNMTDTNLFLSKAIDTSQLTITREMIKLSSLLAQNAHELWAYRLKEENDNKSHIHQRLVPYNLLTDNERHEYEKTYMQLLQFLVHLGYKVIDKVNKTEDGSSQRITQVISNRFGIEDNTLDERSTENRFAFSFLSNLLSYVDKASNNMEIFKESSAFSKFRSSFSKSEDIKFFTKVILPLLEQYFNAHRAYFISKPSSMGHGSCASIKEKEMVCSLFCKLAALLRNKFDAFGTDVNMCTRCLQVLVRSIDIGSVMKNSTEIVRASLGPFFNACAEDLIQTVNNIKNACYSNLNGTLTRGSCSLLYLYLVSLPVLSAILDHIGKNDYGKDLFVNDIAIAGFKILNAGWTIGTCAEQLVQRNWIKDEMERHRPLIGECLTSFAACFPVAFFEPEFFNINEVSSELCLLSPESNEVMQQIHQNIPQLSLLLNEIQRFAISGGQYYQSPHIFDVMIPTLASYMAHWFIDPSAKSNLSELIISNVQASDADIVLSSVIQLIGYNVESDYSPWMKRIALNTIPIIHMTGINILDNDFCFVANLIRRKTEQTIKHELNAKQLRITDATKREQLESNLMTEFDYLIRIIYAFFPILMRYADLHRTMWLKSDDQNAQILYTCIADIFNFWGTSKMFKRQELNYVAQNSIDCTTMLVQKLVNQLVPASKGTKYNPKQKRLKRRLDREKFSSLVVACIKRILPIGLNMYSGPEQELIQLAREKMVQLKISEGENGDPGIEDTLVLTLKSDHEEIVVQFLKTTIQAQLQGGDADKDLTWQSTLYRKIKTKRGTPDLSNSELVIARIMNMAKVLYGLHLVDHPPQGKKGVWRKLISSQRKKAVVACFRVAPLHSIPRHRAINLFVNSYRQYWLNAGCDNETSTALIEKLTYAGNEYKNNEECKMDLISVAPIIYDPLTQFIKCLNRAATTENHTIILDDDCLYLDYAVLMSQSILIGSENEEDDQVLMSELKSIEEQEMGKQKLMMEQNRLADRGVAETVTYYISACKGYNNEMLQKTLQLGISLLHGGNKNVQKGILQHLQDTRDSGFFSSIAILMTNCSVLDLDIFERTLKAQSLGAYQKGTITDGNLCDCEFICRLFRFLQLLCEGHYSDFQNFLRGQTGNNTSVNIVICTVDYLLCLQESMMDFYWHFSGKESMDSTGKECFCRAIFVARQVLNTLTEYIQGPCVQNQLALANSRLWDAVNGFLFMFANLQNKLSKDPKQIELMRELMKLQKDMIIMLLSMLEGNVLQGAIGKQMVDTLIETQPNVEMLLQFFDIFLKIKGLTTSEAFLEFDSNKDGFISPKEFKQAMENQKMYTDEEIEYILMCVDTNQDGKIDFIEFTERFHNPAKDIGFNMAVLLTNLSEHMPHDIRLLNLMEKAKSFLSYFEKSLGRIEIMGSSNRIERVYFEISESNREQWNKPQIKDSKKQFLNSIVNETDDKEKLEGFVNFCEDTIFEMQHAAEISGEWDNIIGQSLSFRSQAADIHKKSVVIVIKRFAKSAISIFQPASFSLLIKKIHQLTIKQIIYNATSFIGSALCYIVSYAMHIIKIFIFCIWQLILEERELDTKVMNSLTYQKYKRQTDRNSEILHSYIDENIVPSTISAFGLEIQSNDKTAESALSTCVTGISSYDTHHPKNFANERKISSLLKKIRNTSSLYIEIDAQDDEPFTDSSNLNNTENIVTSGGRASKTFKSFLALNFYKLKYLALIMAFLINFFVLSYKVVPSTTKNSGLSENVEFMNEQIIIDPNRSYINYVLGILAFVHSCVSFSMLIAYYVLKVPLVIFRREKEISRKLEFDGMWIVEQPSENDIKNNWDKLVLSTASFPSSFWNKFVKKKVRNKYTDQFDTEDLNKLLGLDRSESISSNASSNKGVFSFDWKYSVWKWGVVLTDRSFIYLLLYFAFSVIGNFNYFFFACHLIDIAVSIKTLSTIIVSITQNGRQLLLTITLMAVVVYIYSVIAFNFFRKFYKNEDNSEHDSCSNMFSCFVFHVYHGVRSGGGIGDELESPSGDPLEYYRIAFDLTFFFFVIIILLAILQGLIIDAFGELREQLESVKETLESKCFICGIGQDYFNKEPHGFESHTTKEHDFADYMFFLMHIINKPNTEHTGQESFVWDQYQNRKWDFFPVGDCFRKHCENAAEPN